MVKLLPLYSYINSFNYIYNTIENIYNNPISSSYTFLKNSQQKDIYNIIKIDYGTNNSKYLFIRELKNKRSQNVIEFITQVNDINELKKIHINFTYNVDTILVEQTNQTLNNKTIEDITDFTLTTNTIFVLNINNTLKQIGTNDTLKWENNLKKITIITTHKENNIVIKRIYNIEFNITPIYIIYNTDLDNNTTNMKTIKIDNISKINKNSIIEYIEDNEKIINSSFVFNSDDKSNLKVYDFTIDTSKNPLNYLYKVTLQDLYKCINKLHNFPISHCFSKLTKGHHACK